MLSGSFDAGGVMNGIPTGRHWARWQSLVEAEKGGGAMKLI